MEGVGAGDAVCIPFFSLLDKPDRGRGVFSVVAGYPWWLYVFLILFLSDVFHVIENKAFGGFSQ